MLWETLPTVNGDLFYRITDARAPVVQKDVYEGGFHVWEASVDLVRFLDSSRLSAGRVLELGAGHGLPGLWFVLNTDAHVTFQDLNPECLEKGVELNAHKTLTMNNGELLVLAYEEGV